MAKGVLYVAYGDRFVSEAIRSAKRVKEYMPHLNIAMAADTKPREVVFDDYIEIDVGSADYVPTFLFLNKSPYDKTIHFDTDIHVTGDFEELFDMLEKWDLLATHAPYREQTEVGVPLSFPEVNGGVLAYNKSKEFEEFYSDWKKNYEDIGRDTEQPSLRKTLYENNIDFYILPPEYNARDIGYLHGKAKIFHFREYENVEDTINKINGSNNQRVYYHSWKGVKIIENNYPMTARIRCSISKRGLTKTGIKGLGLAVNKIRKKLFQIGDKYKLINPKSIYDDDYYQRRLRDDVEKDTEKIANKLIEEFDPDSVIDLGCAVGNLLRPFLDNGIEIKGVEGNPSAFKYSVVPKNRLTQHDLREEYYPEKKYDLAISIEVAEHLPERYADVFVDTVVRCGEAAVITAATPGQGGTHHVNEKPHQYWISKFEERGMTFDEQRTNRLRESMNLDTRVNIPNNLLVFS